MCARAGAGTTTHESCTLLEGETGTLPLEGACPEWVMPNAGGVGYYRWSLAPADLERLRNDGYTSLDVRERLSLSRALLAAVRSGTLPVFVTTYVKVTVEPTGTTGPGRVSASCPFTNFTILIAGASPK